MDVDWLVERITLVTDNTRGMHNALTDAAQQAVLNDMGTPGTTLEEYRLSHASRGGLYDRSEYERAVGVAVAGVIEEWLEAIDGDLGLLVRDVIPIRSQDVEDALGAHYLPEPDDMEGILPD